MKKHLENFEKIKLSRNQMKQIMGGLDDPTTTCFVDQCESDSKVTCDGDCEASGNCAWCSADKEGTKRCCIA